jgi:hypothetical protein
MKETRKMLGKKKVEKQMKNERQHNKIGEITINYQLHIQCYAKDFIPLMRERKKYNKK